MTAEELKAVAVDTEVDARGTACPGPLLEAKRAIAECPDDGIMAVLSSDEGTVTDVQRWCNKMGYEYLGDLEDDGFWRVFFKKTA